MPFILSHYFGLFTFVTATRASRCRCSLLLKSCPYVYLITYKGFDIYRVNLNDLCVDFICRTFAVNHYLPLPNFLHVLPTWRLTDRLTPDCLLRFRCLILTQYFILCVFFYVKHCIQMLTNLSEWFLSCSII